MLQTLQIDLQKFTRFQWYTHPLHGHKHQILSQVAAIRPTIRCRLHFAGWLRQVRVQQSSATLYSLHILLSSWSSEIHIDGSCRAADCIDNRGSSGEAVWNARRCRQNAVRRSEDERSSLPKWNDPSLVAWVCALPPTNAYGCQRSPVSAF